MKVSMKKLIWILSITGLILIMAGCSGKKYGGDIGDTEQAIADRIDSFKTAVETYDVEKMLDFLDKTGLEKQLTIAEEGIGSYSKDRAKLKTELEEDQGKQLHWRNPAPEGHGYILTMELGTITYQKLCASGAYAVAPFTIKEEAKNPEIPQQITDKGHMTCQMVKLQGTWRCLEMTINFYSLDKIGAYSAQISTLSVPYRGAHKTGSSKERAKGFCFGRFNF